MPSLHAGRATADFGPDQDGMVLFLIGMRIHSWWRVWDWLPTLLAMPRMLIELSRHRELGLLGAPRTWISGRTVQVQQYWRSFAHLEQYARSRTHAHLPAWRAFNQRARRSRAVGIFHETYVLHAGGVESLYVNMPVMSLAAATRHLPAETRGTHAADRLAASASSPDTPTP